MSFLAETIVGERIADVWVDSEVAYIMLANGTQITVRGLMVVEPVQAARLTPEPQVHK